MTKATKILRKELKNNMELNEGFKLKKLLKYIGKREKRENGTEGHHT